MLANGTFRTGSVKYKKYGYDTEKFSDFAISDNNMALSMFKGEA